MLLAVEGGGFFSSSASGYSKGLTLLLLGQKDEDKPVRVSPWNQYHLVNHEPDVPLELHSRRKWLSKAWATFICFRCASGGADASSHPKVGRADQQEIWTGRLVSDGCDDLKADLGDVTDAKSGAPRSNLRRRSNAVAVPVSDAQECESLVENIGNIPDQIGGRRVQWTDALGTELVEIREFEPSEIDGSEDESDSKNERRCTCTIM